MTIASRHMTQVPSVDANTSLFEAWALMRELGVRHLPVVGGTRLVGVLSYRDLLLHGQLNGRGDLCLDEALVSDVMQSDPVVAAPTTPVSRLVELLADGDVDSIPIVDRQSCCVGLVTSAELLRDCRAEPFSGVECA